MALGAFLAGMVVGRSDFSLRAADRGAADARRLRRAVLRLGRHAASTRVPARGAGLVAATLASSCVGKPLAALRSSLLFMRYPLRVALAVAVALAQIGEFSFILARPARDLGVLADEATNTRWSPRPSSRSRSTRSSTGWSAPSSGCVAARQVAAARAATTRRRGARRRRGRPGPPTERRRRRLRPGRAPWYAAAPGQRDRADRHRAEHRHRRACGRRASARRLRRRHPPRHAGAAGVAEATLILSVGLMQGGEVDPPGPRS